MSNSRLRNLDKTEIPGSTIGFRFHANDEELEEVQSKQVNLVDINSQEEIDNSTHECFKNTSALLDNEKTISDTIHDHKNLFGKRSISVDSAYESPFSNPIETWKKLNVLKEKITKTVEEKIFDKKIDRSILSKPSKSRLLHSKENSSVSDSEDTSESSKLSEEWRDAENQLLNLDKISNENPETHLNVTLDNFLGHSKMETENKKETESKENESEPKNKKSFVDFSELMNLPDIKIATAKSDAEENLIDSSLIEDVESGVEADENLDATEEESIDFFDGDTLVSGERQEGSGGGTGGEGGGGRGYQSPHSGENNFLMSVLGFFNSVILPQSSTLVFLFGFTLYFFFPLPEFIRSFLLSLLLIIFWGTIKSYIQFDDVSLQQRPFVIPDYKSMPPLKVPKSKPVKGVWFNEYERETYDPDYYSVTQTVPAYLELKGCTLKVSRPKGKIRRRATYDEPEYKLQIISQRIYNISGCNIYLLPDGLTRKRLFSKKYPIVIFLRPESLISEKKNGKEVEERPLQEVEAEETLINPESPKSKSTLYLFARCDRQKEEWYRKLLTASRLSTSYDSQKNEKISEATDDTENETEKIPNDSASKESCTPFENLFFDDEVAMLEEYLHYMAKFVGVEVIHPDSKIKPYSSWCRKFKTKKKDTASREEDLNPKNLKKDSVSVLCKKAKSNQTSLNVKENQEEKREGSTYSDHQIQWFNAFINRILFDVFRSPYWLSKIQEKVQRKLNSIRLPYYIEDIEVVEMDLGKTGPMFHRVTQPYMDERGLWFDMDLTFDGLVKLTIQTHLNLIKLQKGMEENEEAGSQCTEKPMKGKKKQRIEKESKDSFLIKESNEESKDLVNENNNMFPKPSESSPQKVEPKLSDTRQLKNESNLEAKSSQSASKLINEVAQFAEFAVEESLFGDKEESEPNTYCPSSQTAKERSPIYDSELEDSAESSDEDDEEETHLQSFVNKEQPNVTPPKRYPRNRRSSKKILKVFENVAQSKYFRSMAQSKYIQKAIAGVSAAKLRLTLEIKSCTGILAVNIPPPPSDRFWYGFREMPTLVFSASPKIGDKTVRFMHIKNYLQKKILHELKAKMVLPNMICVVCSFMVREEYSPIFVNVPCFPKTFGKKVMVTPNMIDFVLPTSTPARSSSFLHIEEPDS